MTSTIASELISVGKDNIIIRVSSGKVVNEASVVGKTNMRLSKSGKGFCIPKARSAFAKLKQTFINASILHHFDLEYHI